MVRPKLELQDSSDDLCRLPGVPNALRVRKKCTDVRIAKPTPLSQKKVIREANSQASAAIAHLMQQRNVQNRRGSHASLESQRDTIRSQLSRRTSVGTVKAWGDSVVSMSRDGKRPCKCCSWWQNKCCSWSQNKLGAKGGHKHDDSDSDSNHENANFQGDPPQLTLKTLARSQNKLYRELTVKELAAIRSRFMERAGVPLDEDKPWPFYLRLQYCFGIFHLRMAVAVKRMRVEREPPDYPIVHAMVSSLAFEVVIVMLIFVNAAVIGWDMMFMRGEERPLVLTLSEYAFTSIFLIEFIMRIHAHTWVWLFNPMNLFDTFVVWVVGVLITYILIPAGVDADLVQRLAALRILRIARLCRVVRMVPVFHELWMLVKGVVECMPLLFWGFVIIGTVLFMFGVATLELIVKTETFRNDPVVLEYFDGLLPTIFTLFQIMTLDSWSAVLRPIIYREPATAVFFFLFIGIAGIMLANLMTAIVVKNSLEVMKEDEAFTSHQNLLEYQKVQKDLRKMFSQLDEDNSGTLSKEEFTDVLDNEMFVCKMKLMDIDLEELPDIFDALDDGDERVSMDEFCTGLTQMQGVAMSRDTLKAGQRSKRANEAVWDMALDMEDYVEGTFESVEDALDESHENFLEMQALTAALLKQLNVIGIRKVVQSTTPDLPKLREPTLEDLEQERKKAAKAKPSSPASQKSQPLAASMPPIPATWIVRERKAREKARRPSTRKRRNTRGGQTEQEQDEPVNGAVAELQAEWARLGLRVETPPSPANASPLRSTADTPVQTMPLPSILRSPAGSRPGSGAGPRPPSTPQLVAAPPPLEQYSMPNLVLHSQKRMSVSIV